MHRKEKNWCSIAYPGQDDPSLWYVVVLVLFVWFKCSLHSNGAHKTIQTPLSITKHTKSLPTLEKSNSDTTMLRRKPTGIKLTTDDIALYEEFKRTREPMGKSNNGNVDPHDTQKASVDTTPDPKMRQKTRDERMGVRQ